MISIPTPILQNGVETAWLPAVPPTQHDDLREHGQLLPALSAASFGFPGLGFRGL